MMHHELRKANERIAYLEGLIRKYAEHVGSCEGVSFLELRYNGAYGGPGFTEKEWFDLRRIAEETD